MLAVLPDAHSWPLQYGLTILGTLLTGVAGALYMTFVMTKVGNAWKIASWTYAAPEPR